MENVKHVKMPEMAFIVGMGRSGTTLLTNMFNSNPSLVSTPENEFIIFMHRSFRDKDFSDPDVAERFSDLFNSNFNKVISVWKPEKKLKNEIASLRVKSFADACKLVYLNYPFINKESKQVKCIIDKNPSYSLYLDRLNDVFPEARYIVLVRDFRDNVLSRKKYSDAKISIYELAASWNFYYRNIFRSLDRLNAPYYLLKYEDLVSDAETTLKKLCEFLGVAYTDEMLNYQDLSKKIKEHVKETVDENVYKKVTTMHANLDLKVNVSRVNAYENELTEEEVSILNYVCSDYGRQFGYLQKIQAPKLSWRLLNLFYKLRVQLYYGLKQVYYSLPVSLRTLFLKK